MMLSFLVIVVSYVSETCALILGYLDTILINVIIWVARIIEVLPFSSYALTISFVMMGVLYILLGIFFGYAYTRKQNETQVTKTNEILTDIIRY
jgi:vacuolar-type H+-ATPase subunit I/STV1